MTKLEVYDPPMCCSSGVCGTNVDTKLVKFLNDIEWLKKQRVDVERYGLSFEPAAFANNDVVKNELKAEGNDCLPLLLVNNEIAHKGNYPERKRLAELCGIQWKEEYTEQEAVPGGVAASSAVCGPDCDCHKSAVNDSSKKFLFAAVVLIILAILLFKTFAKADAEELNTSTPNPIHLVGNKASLGTMISSTSELNFKSIDVAFVVSSSINSSAKSALIKVQKILTSKNVKVGLYTLSSSSSPVLVVYKNGGKIPVTGDINETKLLQAYIAATRYCGSSCPCHK